MKSHEEVVRFQADKHILVSAQNFTSKEEYVLQQMHTYAYLQVAALTENKNVLDLGCNTGYGSNILLPSAKKIVGVDISADAISVAKKRYSGKDIDFMIIDGKELPFPDHEFDIVISCQVIEHIVDYNLYLSEIKRVLSPNGIVIFTTPNALLRLDPGMKPWNQFHVHEFNHLDLNTLLSKFFSEVYVLGLTAKEPLYSIEFNRVKRARENARKKSKTVFISKWLKLMRSSIKAIIPGFILSKVRKHAAQSPPQTSTQKEEKGVDKNFTEAYGFQDFSYRADNLEAALDLLAICSNDKANRQNNREILLQNRPLEFVFNKEKSQKS